jgi:hypothetical protein
LAVPVSDSIGGNPYGINVIDEDPINTGSPGLPLEIVTGESLARNSLRLPQNDSENGHRDAGGINAQENNNNNNNNSSNSTNNSNRNSVNIGSNSRNRENIRDTDLNSASVIVGTDHSNLIVLQPSTTAAYTSMLPSFGHYSTGKLWNNYMYTYSILFLKTAYKSASILVLGTVFVGST